VRPDDRITANPAFGGCRPRPGRHTGPLRALRPTGLLSDHGHSIRDRGPSG
jgi:hypothetical protein